MPTDQALSLCPQTKLNDELNHDKDSYSVQTGFWVQCYCWVERSAYVALGCMLGYVALMCWGIFWCSDMLCE